MSVFQPYQTQVQAEEIESVLKSNLFSGETRFCRTKPCKNAEPEKGYQFEREGLISVWITKIAAQEHLGV